MTEIYNPTIQVTDGTTTAFHSFVIEVHKPDGYPDYDGLIPNMTWDQGVAPNYDFSQHFSASQAITYSATGLPAGVTLNSSTGVTEGAPTGTQAATAFTVTATTAVGDASDTKNITVQAVIADLYPAYDMAFDPVNSFYKVGTFLTNDLANFLARSEVVAGAGTIDVTAEGFLPTSLESLHVNMAISENWSLYVEANEPVFVSGQYSALTQLTKQVGATTYARITRDGYANNPMVLRTTVRNNGATQGTDTNFGSISGIFRAGIVGTAANNKFFREGVLGHTNTTAMWSGNGPDRVSIGVPSSAQWNTRIRLVLAKRSADADADAITWTGA